MLNLIAITETSDVGDVLLSTVTVLHSYSIYRADRASRGGGCAILVNNTFVSSLFANICVEGIESIWVKSRLSLKVSALLG